MVWHFSENFLVQVALGDTVVKGDELHDVTGDRLASRVGQDPIVTVKLLHLSEVSAADADNNDGDWHLGQLVDQVFRRGHVTDDSIGEQKQDLVLLLTLLRSDKVQKLLQQRCKKCWPV